MKIISQHIRRFLWLLPVCFMLASCSESDPYRNLPPTEISAALDSILEQRFSNSEPGVHVMIVRDDSVQYSACRGVADFDDFELVKPSALFNVAESSKSFSVAAVMKLVEQGLLNLDQPVRAFFTDMPTAAFDTITLRQVLTRSTGLPNVIPQNNTEWRALRRNVHTHFSRRRDFIRYGREEDLTLAYAMLDSLPADRKAPICADMDLPFMLVKQIVESVTRQPFDVWLTRNLLEPARLNHVMYRDPDKVIKGLVHAYSPYTPDKKKPDMFLTPDKRWIEDDYGDSPAFLTQADNGVYATGRDFLRWTSALESGKVLRPETVEEIYTPAVHTNKPGVWNGLGNLITTTPDGVKKVYRMSHNGGFYILDVSFPEKKVSYIVFSNHPNWDLPRLMEDIDNILAENSWI